MQVKGQHVQLLTTEDVNLHLDMQNTVGEQDGVTVDVHSDKIASDEASGITVSNEKENLESFETLSSNRYEESETKQRYQHGLHEEVASDSKEIENIVNQRTQHEPEEDESLDAFTLSEAELKEIENKLAHAEETVKNVSSYSVVVQNDIKYLTDELKNVEMDLLSRSAEALMATIQNDENLSLLDRLPQEIIQKIFSYLSPSDLCHKASRVCRRWYFYARDPVLWKKLDFTSCPEISSYVLCRTIKRCPYLRTLILRDRSDLTLVELSVLTDYCPLLKDIDLGFTFLVNNSILDRLVTKCKNLESLNVEGSKMILDDSMPYLTKAEKLKHLNFSHCSITDEGVLYLAENAKKIVSLDIDGISWITDEAIIKLLELHKDHIERLDLDGAELTDSSIVALTKCKNLHTLSISFCELLTDNSLKALQNMSFNCPPRCLKLRKGMDFSPLALHNLFLSESLKHLHTLELAECTRLLDDGVLQMSKCCGPSLRVLTLSWCWNITDKGLIAIVDHCSNLETLDLVGIDKIKGECLDRIPEEMIHLTYLDLRQCNKIIDDLIIDVVRRKPDLKVLNYYGETFIYDAGDKCHCDNLH